MFWDVEHRARQFYAILGKGQTMHSSGQMEHHRDLVHEKSMKVGGLQCIITVDEHVIPLQITNGLPHMKMRPCADEEWERLPKTELTSENEWKPSCLDGGIDDMDQWAESLKILENDERWDMKDHPSLIGEEQGSFLASAQVIVKL